MFGRDGGPLLPPSLPQSRFLQPRRVGPFGRPPLSPSSPSSTMLLQPRTVSPGPQYLERVPGVMVRQGTPSMVSPGHLALRACRVPLAILHVILLRVRFFVSQSSTRTSAQFRLQELPCLLSPRAPSQPATSGPADRLAENSAPGHVKDPSRPRYFHKLPRRVRRCR